jgi:hypothetical protein
VDIRRGHPSWTSVVDIRRGRSSWTFVVDVRRGRSSWTFVVDVRLASLATNLGAPIPDIILLNVSISTFPGVIN